MPVSARRKAALPPTKTVTVYRNGDAFYPGRQVVLNPRQVSTFDNLLSTLTRHLEAPFGVRRLYTPAQGHRVRSLDQLKHRSAYVAAGNEPFKLLDYSGIATMKARKSRNKLIQPMARSRIVASARWKKITDGTCTINVFTNGELLVPPARVRIPKHTLKSWENVLSMVTHKVDLRTGAVFKLCKLDGQPVCGPSELENHQHYVAVGAEKFKHLPYDEWVPCRNLIKKKNATQGQALPPAARNKRLENNTVCVREDLELAVGGQMKEHAAKTERVEQQRQVSRIPALLTAGAGSIFNATRKRSEVEGAAEVHEDPELKADLPIDQVEAKEVEEELETNRKGFLQDSDATCLPNPSAAGPRKDDGQEEKEATRRFARIRSRMSRFFKGLMKF
ncbi:doublecortin domain-containing protein 2 [Fundulus heteroclitus]|uniref:doublecortin domain-containing protein 2 n=1 Tax=Fundulus heteroclitus TaxID=8078 RepID=UPI00165CD8C0|nr:doublecortin domain-containing protein 2 [Fundulus heteroclitus]XP_036006810.1 doublecortin domain-containing protein 2 [Fundulus heteroclitus]